MGAVLDEQVLATAGDLAFCQLTAGIEEHRARSIEVRSELGSVPRDEVPNAVSSGIHR